MKNKESKLTSFIMAFAILLSAFSINISAVETNNYTIEDGVLTAFSGSGGDIVIPSDVTKINPAVFQNKGNITSVTFSGNTTEIGDYAFAGCSGLVSVTLPSSIKVIDKGAFKDCHALKTLCGNVNGGDAFSDALTNLGNEAFSGCSSLCDTINIPSGMKNVAEFSFFLCSSITRINLSNGVEKIELAAFSGANPTTVVIPQTCTEVGHAAFQSSSLLSVQFLNDSTTLYSDIAGDKVSIKDINKDVFKIKGYENSTAQTFAQKMGYNFEAVKSENDYFAARTGTNNISFFDKDAADSGRVYDIVVPSILSKYIDDNGTITKVSSFSVTGILDDGVFEGSSVKSVAISNGLSAVGNNVFKDCSNLSSVEFSDTIQNIGYCCADNMTALKSVIVKNPYCTISEKLFYAKEDSSVLQNVKFYGSLDIDGNSTLKEWCDNHGYKFYEIGSIKIIPQNDSYPTTDASHFKSAGDWKNISWFDQNAGITDVVTPTVIINNTDGDRYSEITGTLEYQAFKGDSDLKSVLVSEGISHIASGSFSDCTSLESITLPSSVNEMEGWNENLNSLKTFVCLNPYMEIAPGKGNDLTGDGTNGGRLFGFTSYDVQAAVHYIGVEDENGYSTLKNWCNYMRNATGKLNGFKFTAYKTQVKLNNSEFEHGKVTMTDIDGNEIQDGEILKPNTTVYFTVKPENGYKLRENSLKINDLSNGIYNYTAINVFKDKENDKKTYQLTLPAHKPYIMTEKNELTVSAEFEPICDISFSVLGVQIRNKTQNDAETTDMRFVSRFNIATKNFNVNGVNAELVNYGMLLCENSVLTDSETQLKFETPDSIGTLKAVEFNGKSAQFSSDDSLSAFNNGNGTFENDIRLLDIKNTNSVYTGSSFYNTSISTRAFVEYKTENGEYGVLYSDILIRTCSEIKLSPEFSNDQTITKISDEEMSAIKNSTKDKIATIKNTASDYPQSANTYFVANDGDDDNSGSVDSPWKSIEKVNNCTYPSGSVVLFKRGDVFRGHLKVQSNVTYSAYGTGGKPGIYGSDDASSVDKWQPTAFPNVYKYTEDVALNDEVGNIVFNNGEAWGIKMFKLADNTSLDIGIVTNGLEIFYENSRDFTGEENLVKNLEFYQDYSTNSLYLYCNLGNPGDIFDSIEISKKGDGALVNTIGDGTENITIDNLALMYTGGHGVGCSESTGFTMKNCELAWIGGSVQDPAQMLNLSIGEKPIRYGNGIEAWSRATSYHVYNNYFSQIYDACMTAQYNYVVEEGTHTDHIFNDVQFNNNVCEKSNTAIEIWIKQDTQFDNNTHGQMNNVDVSGNVGFNLGYGWSCQRSNKDSCAFYSDPFESYCTYNNASITNNTFYNSKYYLAFARYISGGIDVGYNLSNNTFIHSKDKDFGLLPPVAWSFGNRSYGDVIKYSFASQKISELLIEGKLTDSSFYYE